MRNLMILLSVVSFGVAANPQIEQLKLDVEKSKDMVILNIQMPCESGDIRDKVECNNLVRDSANQLIKLGEMKQKAISIESRGK